MLKLNASYSKKVPAEGEYSSQSYHASIEVELPDGLSQEQLNGKIHETFAMVRDSVEAELHGNVPANHGTPEPQGSRNPAPQGGRSAGNNNDVPASPKQISSKMRFCRPAARYFSAARASFIFRAASPVSGHLAEKA